jgi:hypothetical protein
LRRTTIRRLILGAVLAASLFGVLGAAQTGQAEAATVPVCYNNVTMKVAPSIASFLLARGATAGECTPASSTICFNGVTHENVSASFRATLIPLGATDGPCPTP